MPLHEIVCVLLIGVCGFNDAAYAPRLSTSHAHMHICFAAFRWCTPIAALCQLEMLMRTVEFFELNTVSHKLTLIPYSFTLLALQKIIIITAK